MLREFPESDFVFLLWRPASATGNLEIPASAGRGINTEARPGGPTAAHEPTASRPRNRRVTRTRHTFCACGHEHGGHRHDDNEWPLEGGRRSASAHRHLPVRSPDTRSRGMAIGQRSATPKAVTRSGVRSAEARSCSPIDTRSSTSSAQCRSGPVGTGSTTRRHGSAATAAATIERSWEMPVSDGLLGVRPGERSRASYPRYAPFDTSGVEERSASAAFSIVCSRGPSAPRAGAVDGPPHRVSAASRERRPR